MTDTPVVQRHRTVLHLLHVDDKHAVFGREPDEGEVVPVYNMPLDEYADLGSPDAVTLWVFPGAVLEEQIAQEDADAEAE